MSGPVTAVRDAVAAPVATRVPRPILQRCGGTACPPGTCSHDDERRLARSASGAEPTNAPAIVHDVLRSPGRPLDAETRSLMERSLGHDFSRVRIHADQVAGNAARAVHAQAYTVGTDIAFAPGRYAPGTGEGRKLLAHELTHVVQQSMRSSVMASADSLAVSSPTDPQEQEAEAVAARACAGRMAGVRLGAAAPIACQHETTTPATAESPGPEEEPGSGQDVILPGQIVVDPEASSSLFPPQIGPAGPGAASASGAGSPAAAGRPSPSSLEEALVGRSEPASAWSASPGAGSPEREAAAETPYRTGMSGAELDTALGRGVALDDAVRRKMARQFHADLAGVRVHTGPSAQALCTRFAAEAFSHERHVAFRDGAYDPASARGERLLRHELAHAIGQKARGGSVFRQAACPGTCPPGTAPPFVPLVDHSFNCYAYAMNSPGSGFLHPGQIAGSDSFKAQQKVRRNPAATKAQLKAILPYFTPAAVRANATADLGAPLGTSCVGCCDSSKRKVVAVATDKATAFIKGVNSAGAFVSWRPMVDAANRWDFHWYRKDSDGAWSHKRGQLDPQRDDAGGTVPICNPCAASRSYPPYDYRNVIAEWCVT